MSAPPEGNHAARQHQEVQTLLNTDTAARCSLRALQALVKKKEESDDYDVELRYLQDALRPTAFGRAFEPAYIDRLLPAAEYCALKEGAEVELVGDTDGLYLLVAGNAQVISGPHVRTRPLNVTIISAKGLPGNTHTDILDPYVVVAWGSKQAHTNVAMDAGENPVFNWTTTIPYGIEPALEFLVMEHNAFSKHELLCFGRLSITEFDKAGFEGTIQLEVSDAQAQLLSASLSSGNLSPAARQAELDHMGGSLQVRLDWGDKDERRLARSLSISDSQEESVFGKSLTLSPDTTSHLMEQDELPMTAFQSSPGELTRTVSTTQLESATAGAPAVSNGRLLKSATNRVMQGNRLKSMFAPKEEVHQPQKKSPIPTAKVAPAPWRTPGHRFGAGQFFGLEEGGGIVRMLENSVLLHIPRARVREALQEAKHEVRRDQQQFLRNYLPAGKGLDKRVFDTFSAAFQVARFPRGHVLVAAGVPSASESQKVYIIKSGTCRVLLPAPPKQAVAVPPPPSPGGAQLSLPSGSGKGSASSPDLHSAKKVEELLRPPAHATPIGLVGEGSIVGYASALFGVPEPFAIVPDEPVTVMYASVADRPIALWPKEVIKGLHEQMKAQTEWHRRRTQNVSAAIVASAQRFQDPKEGPPQWTVSKSPFLRHKELSTWQTDTMKDRFESEGWMPQASSSTAPGASAASPRRRHGGAPRLSPQSQEPRSQSCPSLPALPTASGSPAGSQGAQRNQAGGSSLASVPTPWGAWSPSGAMLPPKPKGDDPAARQARARLRKFEAEKRRNPMIGHKDPVYRVEPQRHTLNLKCDSDWRSLNANASRAAVEKMYKQQVRKNRLV